MNPPATTTSAAREYLYGLVLHGIKLGLDNIHGMLARLGRPEQQYPAIHVAGTNGKGSVLAFLDAMLYAAGYRTGRFTSPHLVDITERFLCEGVPMREEELTAAIEAVRAAGAGLPHPPTFFEVNTAVAFWWFAQRRVDAALVEVGMGGRLDSTNVLTPIATAITNIDLDHMEYLGDTLAKIAAEKAGIIKPGTPVVISETKPEALNVLLAHAERLGAPVRLLGRDFAYTCTPIAGAAPVHCDFRYTSDAFSLGPVRLGLAGAHQGENAATAVALALDLRQHFPRLDDDAIRRGLERALWPGRLETVLDSPRVIMDVAHNPAGAARVVAAMPPSVVVFGVSSDKDAAAMLRILRPIAAELVLTQFHGKRALALEELQAAAGELPVHIEEDVERALAWAMPRASHERPLLITGSIYLSGEARALLIRHYGAQPLRFV